MIFLIIFLQSISNRHRNVKFQFVVFIDNQNLCHCLRWSVCVNLMEKMLCLSGTETNITAARWNTHGFKLKNHQRHYEQFNNLIFFGKNDYSNFKKKDSPSTLSA
jgi:hypothetical protein